MEAEALCRGHFKREDYSELDSMEVKSVIREAKKTLEEMKGVLESGRKKGRPKKGTENESRYTVLIGTDKLKVLHEIAYQRRILMKEVIDEAVTDYIKKVESEDGREYFE